MTRSYATLWCFSMAIIVQTKLFLNLFRWDLCYVAANNLDGNTAMKMSLSVMSRDHKLSPQLPFYYFSLQSFWVCYVSRVLRELHLTRCTSQLFITQTILKLSHQQTEPQEVPQDTNICFEYLPSCFFLILPSFLKISSVKQTYLQLEGVLKQ